MLEQIKMKEQNDIKWEEMLLFRIYKARKTLKAINIISNKTKNNKRQMV